MILDLQLLTIFIIPLLTNADHCGPVSETADSTIDPDAGDSVVLAEINNTTQKYCQESCCDILETDGCNTALFHHITDKCTLIRCENEKCSLITDSNFTTTSIGVIEDVITTDQPHQNTQPTAQSPIQVSTTATDNKATSSTTHTQDDASSTTRLIPPNTLTAGTNNTPANTFTSGKSATTTESFLTTLLNISRTSEAAPTKHNNITDTVTVTDKTEPPVSRSTTQHQDVQSAATLPATKLLISTVQGTLAPSQGTHIVNTTTSSHITDKIDQPTNTTVEARTTLEPTTLSSNKTTSHIVITDTGNTTEPSSTEMDVPITTTLGHTFTSTRAIPPTTSSTLESATSQLIPNATHEKSTNATQQGETAVIPTQILKSQTNRTIPTSQPIQTTIKAASTFLVKSPQSISQSPSNGNEKNVSTEPVTTTESLLNTTAALENQTESSNSHSSATAKHFFVSQDDQLPALLIAASSIGIIFIFTVFVLLGKRVFDSWQRRHYSRIDYLINGMYN